MTAWLTRLFALLLLLPLLAAAPPAGPSAAEVERLVKQLGGDDFDTREIATARLKLAGEPALDALHKALSSGDLEVRRRAARIIWALDARLQILCYEGHSERVMGVAFSPDGRRVISLLGPLALRLFSPWETHHVE